MIGRRLFLLAAVGAGIAVAAGASFVSTTTAEANKAPVFTGLVKGVAVGGYDPVAYFKSGKPVPGSTAHVTEHEGATWRFATAENLQAFKAEPAKYAPQYGGYCAWAVSQGYTAKGDPKHWKIVDGKLYLNYDANIQSRWEGDIPGFIRKADANWPKALTR